MKKMSLKTQIAPLTMLFIAVHIVILYILITGTALNRNEIQSILEGVISKTGAFAAIMGIISIVLNGLVPPQIKAILVFWKIKYPLPGCRAFSELAARDFRINIDRLQEQLGSTPTEPEQQNRAWYRLYKQHENAPSVITAHRVYLLTRDLASLSMLFLIAFPQALYFSGGPWTSSLLYFGSLLVQYTLISLSARNYGCRFTENVLAVASA